MNCETNDLLTRREVAGLLRVSVSTVKRMENVGRLVPVRVTERCVRHPAAIVQNLVKGAA